MQVNRMHVFSCWARSCRVNFAWHSEHSTSCRCLSLWWRTTSFTCLRQTGHTFDLALFRSLVSWITLTCRLRLWTCSNCLSHIPHTCFAPWSSFLCRASNCFVLKILRHVSHSYDRNLGFPTLTDMPTSVFVATWSNWQSSQGQSIFNSFPKFHASLPTLMASATFRPTFITWCRIPYRIYKRSPAFCSTNSYRILCSSRKRGVRTRFLWCSGNTHLSAERRALSPLASEKSFHFWATISFMRAYSCLSIIIQIFSLPMWMTFALSAILSSTCSSVKLPVQPIWNMLVFIPSIFSILEFLRGSKCPLVTLKQLTTPCGGLSQLYMYNKFESAWVAFEKNCSTRDTVERRSLPMLFSTSWSFLTPIFSFKRSRVWLPALFRRVRCSPRETLHFSYNLLSSIGCSDKSIA